MPIVHINSKHTANLDCGRTYLVSSERQLCKLVKLHQKTCEICRNDEKLTKKLNGRDAVLIRNITYKCNSSSMNLVNVEEVGTYDINPQI